MSARDSVTLSFILRTTRCSEGDKSVEHGEHWSSLITRWRQNCNTVSADRLAVAVAECLRMYCPKMNILSSFTHAQCHSDPHIFCLLQTKKSRIFKLFYIQEKFLVIYADNSKKARKVSFKKNSIICHCVIFSILPIRHFSFTFERHQVKF